jgi:hypothetical protein
MLTESLKPPAPYVLTLRLQRETAVHAGGAEKEKLKAQRVEPLFQYVVALLHK